MAPPPHLPNQRTAQPLASWAGMGMAAPATPHTGVDAHHRPLTRSRKRNAGPRQAGRNFNGPPRDICRLQWQRTSEHKKNQ